MIDELREKICAKVAEIGSSGSISIQSGEQVYEDAFGFRDRANELPNTVATRFGREKEGAIYLGNRLMGEMIEIPTVEIKRVIESFPELTITLIGNRKIRVDGRHMTTRVYSQFIESLTKHESLNKSKNKEQNQSAG